MPAPFVKYTCSILYILLLCQKSGVCRCGSSIWFHWFSCLFLCQYQAVFSAVSLEESLKSGSVMAPEVPLLYRIVLAIMVWHKKGENAVSLECCVDVTSLLLYHNLLQRCAYNANVPQGWRESGHRSRPYSSLSWESKRERVRIAGYSVKTLGIGNRHKKILLSWGSDSIPKTIKQNKQTQQLLSYSQGSQQNSRLRNHPSDAQRSSMEGRL